MQIIQFESQEQMHEWLEQQRAQAHRGLHPQQEAIQPGTFWVRFVDIKAEQKIVEFGFVAQPQDVADHEVDHGGSAEDAALAVDNAQVALANGYLTGMAWSLFSPEGEWGHTHKAHVWPIEERLFMAAAEAKWNVDALPPSGKVLLEIAYRALRAHVQTLPNAGEN